ncbi:cation:proton antiporter [Shewanella sp. JNE10-2]|uniref:cation:proton antiporter family protein n=1 Tax=unclassified Shewanella TaxID=196818 RepID=UPI0020058A3B|nr:MULTISPECIES: cation:proton antiporter family protein [unclassified Shewanella]MCK7629023.1 cation:proton antiporter [Shewanella sp. JNE9-1]MCK7644517.1 cation:proton antiporter [Shewanella sp. JNE3-1]MCK7652326.1 cation:proton antiporter [Shewanella sp. JNE4-1]UPO27613.1 cation:proton antiporter [Shewanella sp. JNE10-2]UPO34820.1 cation:proton antiporter [Shewanella sp. JNE7]
MEPAILVITLVCGMLVSRIGLPPLIGYLVAGFVLFVLGIEKESLPLLQELANLGVTLLLFAIGLKLDIRSLFKAEVWAGSSIHLILSMLIFVPILKILGLIGLSQLTSLNIEQLTLLAFALSFSSTVFAVKVLEDKGDIQSLYGRVAIGILIMQDIFAVLFLTISKGDVPSVWAFALLLLPLAKPLIYKAFDRVGHGELLVLFGLVMALVVGAWLFEVVGLKPDLGALIIGILLAGHKKSSELAKSLFYFKELFLVAFFLTIGLNGLPSVSDIVLAALLVLLVPLKILLFVYILTRFKLRSRTSMLGSFNLGNFSEFGLIVAAVATSKGWLPSQWLVIIAVALSFSFLLAAPLNATVGNIYQRFQQRFVRFEKQPLHPEDRPIAIGNPRFLILGMGRIGSGAYDELRNKFEGEILGIEHKQELVDLHRANGRNVVKGDASDTDFWEKLDHAPNLELVLLAMPHHAGNMFAVEQLKKLDYQGKISAIVQYSDDADALRASGVHSVYNLYEAAGAGFVDHVIHELLQASDKTTLEEQDALKPSTLNNVS